MNVGLCDNSVSARLTMEETIPPVNIANPTRGEVSLEELLGYVGYDLLATGI